MKPHKHAEVIKAWADGATLERRVPNSNVPNLADWHPSPNPQFNPIWDYRVKPREFPKSSLSNTALKAAFDGCGIVSFAVCVRAVANAAIKQYILDQEAQQ